jgi:hypothetical protein
MSEQKREVTEADCIAEINDAIKDMNPYQKELFFQRLEQRFAAGPKRKPEGLILPFYRHRDGPPFNSGKTAKTDR